MALRLTCNTVEKMGLDSLKLLSSTKNAKNDKGRTGVSKLLKKEK